MVIRARKQFEKFHMLRRGAQNQFTLFDIASGEPYEPSLAKSVVNSQLDVFCKIPVPKQAYWGKC